MKRAKNSEPLRLLGNQCQLLVSVFGNVHHEGVLVNERYCLSENGGSVSAREPLYFVRSIHQLKVGLPSFRL